MATEVAFTAMALLERLTAQEMIKPKEQRREVPSVPELAKAAGLAPKNMRRILNNGTEAINRRAIATVVRELRARGFRVHFDDIFEMVEVGGRNEI